MKKLSDEAGPFILGCRDLTTSKDSDPQISRLTTMDNGYRVYNLGPVGDYPYKELFVTDLEPIYGLALVPEGHPLWSDTTSPLFTDFPEGGVNSLYRSSGSKNSSTSIRPSVFAPILKKPDLRPDVVLSLVQSR